MYINGVNGLKEDKLGLSLSIIWHWQYPKLSWLNNTTPNPLLSSWLFQVHGHPGRCMLTALRPAVVQHA